MATSHPATSPAAPRPESPGFGSVPLSSVIGDLLRFVLSSNAAATPGDELAGFPLSPSYCARLLDDGGDLCGKLATATVQCLEEGRLPGPPTAVGIPVAEEGPVEEWEKVLLEKGAQLKLVKAFSLLSPFGCFFFVLSHEFFKKRIGKGDGRDFIVIFLCSVLFAI